MARGPSPAARAEALLLRHWWQPRPTALALALAPLAALYGRLAERRRASHPPPRPLPVPLVVVGNVVVGGAGKTPTVIALVQALQAAGHRPGIVSRGHGRAGSGVMAVDPEGSAAAAGDEPLLLARRTGVPVWVGKDRSAAARALCEAHPEVDVLVADDGLQHLALERRAEVVVFDDRGAGNGLLLPAGPLREPLPLHLGERTRVLYTGGTATTPLPGSLALRVIGDAWPLAAWRKGDRSAAQPLASLQGRPLVAAAGLAAPQKFFAVLDAAGLSYAPLPLPDHHAYATLPWPAPTADVVTTEKDAVKLDPARLGATRVWVVPLDLQLPAALVDELTALLFPAGPQARPAPGPAPAPRPPP